MSVGHMGVSLRCTECRREYGLDPVWQCGCGGILEVVHSDVEITRAELDRRLSSRGAWYSGVWLYKELVHPLIPDDRIISRSEGRTNLYSHRLVSGFSGIADVRLKHEGENPTGSFKDRGMTVGVSEALRLGYSTVACASTGNTSASMASYAALASMASLVFVPSGKIAASKLAQAIAYGARVVQIRSNFDRAMSLVIDVCKERDIYLLNSINPWRVEGQKTITFELIQQMGWKSPDWIVLPAGNMGNTAAAGKALMELHRLGFIDKVPRLAPVQAEGANPLYRMWKSKSGSLAPVSAPETVATAIRIGNPVSWKKALAAVKWSKGTVEQVSDQEIMDAKAVIDASGIGCEPASAASLAGAKKLREAGVIGSDESVVCILTGNLLKDPDSTLGYHTSSMRSIVPARANRPIEIEDDKDKILAALSSLHV